MMIIINVHNVKKIIKCIMIKKKEEKITFVTNLVLRDLQLLKIKETVVLLIWLIMMMKKNIMGLVVLYMKIKELISANNVKKMGFWNKVKMDKKYIVNVKEERTYWNMIPVNLLVL